MLPFNDKESLCNYCMNAALSKFFIGLIVTDRDGIVIEYNTQASIIEQIPRKQAIGRSVLELYSNPLSSNKKTPISSFIKCMEENSPIINIFANYVTLKGQTIKMVQDYYPICYGNIVVGSFCLLKEVSTLVNSVTAINDILSQTVSSLTNSNTQSPQIIGNHPTIKQAIFEANCISKNDVDALVIGETGTGKELFVQKIHHNGLRSKEPFVPINCAAIPENLMEGILFGTRKGAFTDAMDSIGLFETAAGGTLFLDELNSMSLSCQTKLLRVLQERKIRRIGDGLERPIKCRVIGAVNRDPYECIDEGSMRIDLFYRLSVGCISIPPLREHIEDIDVLVKHYILRFNMKHKKHITDISLDLKKQLYSHSWPGNIRELINLIESMYLMIGDDNILDLKHIPRYSLERFKNTNRKTQKIYPPNTSLPLAQSLYDYEKTLINSALKTCDGNQRAASEKLGISPQSLHYKLSKYQIK